MTSHYERSLERVMMTMPNFTPRGYGVMVMNRFVYTDEICDCRYCTEIYKNKCRQKVCICFAERMEAGAIRFSDLLGETFSEVKNRRFRSSLYKYMKESEMNLMFYRGNAHKDMFQKAIADRPGADAAMLSALYLLTADKRLWSKVHTAVSRSCIAFGAVKLGDISTDAYTLFVTAKDLCYGTKHITISDIADKEIVSPKLFEIICNAMTIRRHGKNVIQIAERNGVK